MKRRWKSLEEVKEGQMKKLLKNLAEANSENARNPYTDKRKPKKEPFKGENKRKTIQKTGYHPTYKRARTEGEKMEICGLLLEIWNKVPDQRLGQMLDNYLLPSIGDMFFVEDYDLIEILKRNLKA